MLRFSVDFLWISVSKWTVKFSLCLEMLMALTFPPGHYPNTLVYVDNLQNIFSGNFLPLCTAEHQLPYIFLQIMGLKYSYQILMKKPKCLRLDSLVLSKEDPVVCPEIPLGNT